MNSQRPRVLLPDEAQRELRTVRMFFFVFIGAGGFLIPFLNLVYNRAGMNGAQIGILAMLAALCAMLAAPVWGRWSDRSGQTRRLLQFELVTTAVAALALGMQRTFSGFAALTSLQAILNAGSIPLSTALAMMVVAHTHSSGFGDIRRWGSLGWAVFVLSAGPVMQRLGLWVLFPAYAFAFMLSALMLQRVDSANSTGEHASAAGGKSGAGNSYGAALNTLVHERGLLWLMIAVLISGVLNAGWRSFWQIDMDHMGAPESLIAMAAMASAAVEMPAMLWADRWATRYGGKRLLTTALLLDTLRLTVVYLFQSPLILLLGNAFGGIAYSLTAVGLVVYVLERTPPAQAATMLAIFGVTLANLIVILGAPLGGLVFDSAGARWLYAMGAAGNLAGFFILYQTTNNSLRRSSNEYS
jgi:MFS transporter, PPP family, 3-phenylpropionic acid transporter